MQDKFIDELRRQSEICNACRYCEGYCSVFPAMHESQSLAEADLTQIANICHNCRGCYYACQYTFPHEFDLNLPKALADVRRESWEEFAWPNAMARRFHDNALTMIGLIILGFVSIFAAVSMFGTPSGASFYDVLSHDVMLAIFIPASIFPFISLIISMRRYWKKVEGERLTLAHVKSAFSSVIPMKELAAGHGEGCNFEDEDRFSHARRHAHHAIMYGFLLCFASTLSGTVLHYLFDQPAPYGFLSLPKLLGVPGGILMMIGAAYMIVLKLKSDRNLGDASAWESDLVFAGLLGFIALTGLVLWLTAGTVMLGPMLILHLGAVLAFFIVTPFSKMVHGFYRVAALLRNAQRQD